MVVGLVVGGDAVSKTAFDSLFHLTTTMTNHDLVRDVCYFPDVGDDVQVLPVPEAH